MTAVPLLSTLLLAGPCADPSLAAARLASAQAEADFAHELAEVETGLGTSLLLHDELARPLAERTGLAAARLGTACAWLNRPPAPGEDRAAALRAVLDRPAFMGARDRAPHAVGQVWERLKAWLLSFLEDRTTRSFASGVRWLVLALSSTLAGAVLWRVWAGRRGPPPRVLGAPAAVITPRTPAVDHLGAARALVSEAPRAALREGLLALLSALEQAGWLTPARALTNRELADSLHGFPGGDEAGALLRAYDRRYYSLDLPTPEDAARYVEAVEGACARLPREVAR
jgi:hypothetical protein